jgi:hypothetical protein
MFQEGFAACVQNLCVQPEPLSLLGPYHIYWLFVTKQSLLAAIELVKKSLLKLLLGTNALALWTNQVVELSKWLQILCLQEPHADLAARVCP